MLQQVRVIERHGDVTRLLRRLLRHEKMTDRSSPPGSGQSRASHDIAVVFVELEAWRCDLESGAKARPDTPSWVTWWQVPPTEATALAVMRGIMLTRRAAPGSLVVAQVGADADPALVSALSRAGASLVLEGYLGVPDVARQISRFWRKIPRPCLSLEERIWKNLPWSQNDAPDYR